jgi:hypothetical protein
MSFPRFPFLPTGSHGTLGNAFPVSRPSIEGRETGNLGQGARAAVGHAAMSTPGGASETFDLSCAGPIPYRSSQGAEFPNCK